MSQKVRTMIQEKMSWCNKDTCCKYVKQKLPVLAWSTAYELAWLPQDALAGFTVGLTAIPQGIAYGIVAGLSPEYGLYASFMASFVYIIFGSCDSITIGPTAIMATMVQPLVTNYGPDIVVLLSFLKGCIIAALGLLHLGFLLDFISLPVIAGFTTAAAINIAASQFNPLLGISIRSEDLVDALYKMFSNLDKVRYQDTVLSLGTIIVLALLKNLPGRRNGTWQQKIAWALTLARNALVVVAGATMAYIFKLNGQEPFKLTGTMGEGLPPFGPPPFSITANNRTYDFLETISSMGTTLFSVPVVSTIEHMAIAKAFAMGKTLDATQEMFALGVCNVFGSFVRSMPVTGSFTRTAVNHTSGVKTTFGGLFTGCLVLLAVGLLTTTFRFIPKATLAGIIISAMYYLIDFTTFALLWRAKKTDFLLMIITLLFCVFLKLEWGIIIGIGLNLLLLLYFSTRPSVDTATEQCDINELFALITAWHLASQAGVLLSPGEYTRRHFASTITCVCMTFQLPTGRIYITNVILPIGSLYDSMDKFCFVVGDETVIRVTPEESVAFPAAETFRATIMKLTEKNQCNVLLDCKNLKRIDVTVAKNLKLLGNDLQLRGRTIACVNCSKNVEAVLKVVAPNL